MNFGDWELFRVLVLGLREREADEEFIAKNVRFADTHIQRNDSQDLEDTAAPSSLLSTSSGEGSLVRRGNVTQL